MKPFLSGFLLAAIFSVGAVSGISAQNPSKSARKSPAQGVESAKSEKIVCESVRQTSIPGELLKVKILADDDGDFKTLRVEENYIDSKLVTKKTMIADRMIVKLKKSARKSSFEQFCSQNSLKIAGSIPGSPDVYLVNFTANDTESLPRAKSLIESASDSVEYAEPDYIYYPLLTPDDPKFTDGTLWGMNKIDGPAAWDIGTGSHDIVIGVIDTGVDYDHEDLKDNMWTNPGEIAGNGIDDDANGYVDDIYGIDAINNDSDPMDDHGHGTHCSGTIGGVGNNAKGVVGVSWKVRVMALKFLGTNGGSTSGAIACVNYATKMGAHLTSNSWGGGAFSQTLRDAITANGKLFAAAAGNDTNDNDASPSYPASYDCENILAVAATDSNDALASFSNYGATSVDIAAPGVDIYSAKPGGGYQTMSGTSMATPHVGGAGALVLSLLPTMTTANLKSALMDGADPVPGLNGKCVTGARLNIAETLGSLTMKVVSPNGSEVFKKGDGRTIAWNSVLISDKVKIELMKNGISVAVIAEETENDGSYDWTVADSLENGSDYKVQISVLGKAFSDQSDADFAISDVVFKMTMLVSPAGSGTTSPSGEKDVLPATPCAISAVPNKGFYFKGWSAAPTASIANPLSENTEATLSANSSISANFGEYAGLFKQDFETGENPPSGWTIVNGQSSPGDLPAHWGTSSSYNNTPGGTYSGACPWGKKLDERLNSPSVDLSGVEKPQLSFWWSSSYYWHVSPNDNGDLFVEVSTDNGATWEKIWTFGNIGEWSNFVWYNTKLDLSKYVGNDNVKISFHIVANDNADIAVDDIELIVVPLPPVPQLLSPVGGESLYTGTAYQIAWKMPGKDKIKIELLKSGAPDALIAEQAENTGAFLWQIPLDQKLGADFKIKLSNASVPANSDESDADFAIKNPALQIISPNGGETWTQNTPYEVKWSSEGMLPGDNVSIDLLKASQKLVSIAESAPNSGALQWKPGENIEPGNDYTIKIFLAPRPDIADLSDASFTVLAAPKFELMAIALPSDGGSTVPASGTTVLVSAGAPYEIEAIPATGYFFNGWTALKSAKFANANMMKTAVTLSENDTATAAFSSEIPDTAMLTISISPPLSGKTTPAPGVVNVLKNVPAPVSAEANPGWKFVNWTFSGSAKITDTALPQTDVTLGGTGAIVANFAEIPRDVKLNCAVEPAEGGSMTPLPGGHNVKTGEDIPVIASPAESYYFTGWTQIDGARVKDASSASTSVKMNADGKVVANFSKSEPASKNLTIVVGGNGETEPATGNYSIKVGVTQQIKASPKPGSVFKEWQVIGGTVADLKAPLTTVLFNDDTILTAKFENGSSTLTMAVMPEKGGSTAPAVGTQTFENNSMQNISAKENIGFMFMNWTIVGAATIIDAKLPSTSIVLTGDASAIANFAPIAPKADLTMAVNPAEAGTTLPALGTSIVDTAVEFEISASPSPGFVFTGWSATEKAVLTDAAKPSTKALTTGDATITANFETAAPVNFEISSNPSSSGSTQPQTGTHKLTPGIKHPIKAVAAESFVFSSWTASGGAVITNPLVSETEVILDADGSAVANFEIYVPKYKLTVVGGSGSGLYAEAMQVPVVADPAPDGMSFDSWSGDIANISNPIAYSTNIIMPKQDIQITANYKKIFYTLTVVKGSGGGSYSPNAQVQIVAESIEGKEFFSWSVSGSSELADKSASSTTCTVKGNSTVTANYVDVGGGSSIVVASPNGGESLLQASTHEIAWISKNLEGNVKVELYQNGVFSQVLSASEGNDGAYAWTVPASSGDGYKIKISSLDGKSSDYSDASFAIVGSASVKLKMVCDGADQGETSPSVGIHTVQANTSIEILAVPEAGYKFARWEGDSNVSITDKTSESSFAIPIADCTVTAVFRLDYKIGDFGKVKIKLDSAKTNSDSILITKSEVPDDVGTDDFSVDKFHFKLVVDDFSVELNRGIEKLKDTGTLKKAGKKEVYVYKPNEGQAAVSLILSLGDPAKGKKPFYSIKVSKVQAFSKIDSSDGLDIFFSVGDKLFGDNIDLDESMQWSFVSPMNTSESIETDGTQANPFTIQKASGKSSNFAQGKDAFSIVSATIEKIDFDLTDSVSISIDERVEIIENLVAASADKKIFKAKGQTADLAKYALLLDFGSGLWSFRLGAANDLAEEIYENDGVDIILQVGDYESGLRLNGSRKITLSYPKK